MDVNKMCPIAYAPGASTSNSFLPRVISMCRSEIPEYERERLFSRSHIVIERLYLLYKNLLLKDANNRV